MNETNFENTVVEAPAAEPVASAAEKKSFFSKVPKPALIGAAVVVAIIAVVAIILAIVNRDVPVEKIDMEEESIQLRVGDFMMLEYDIYPSKASSTGAEWKSSDEKVATVSSVGQVKAIGSGKCTITLEIDGEKGMVEVFVMPDLKELYSEHCSSVWATVGSDGSYLEIDTNPYNRDNYSDSSAISAIITVTEELGLPDSLISSMSSTTALMGRQSETFDDLGIKVEWAYHPDNGLEVIYRVVK